MQIFTRSITLAAILLLAVATPARTQDNPESKLIAVLKSEAPQKEKVDACRELARVGTKEAVPALILLLADEQLSHNARYALETIADPSVDVALRAALLKLKGRMLIGVIGSVGARKDGVSIEALARLLRDQDIQVAHAAARALGAIGSPVAGRVLDTALLQADPVNLAPFAEGLLRCAEASHASGQVKEAMVLYDHLRAITQMPHQVRAAALRGAVLTRQKDGIKLLLEAFRSTDYVMTEAAARTAMELSGPEIATVLAAELEKLPVAKQILTAQVLGKLGEIKALPALHAATKSGDKNVRLAAIRALPEIGDAASAPVLIGLLDDADAEVAKAAQESVAGLRGAEVDAAVMKLLEDKDTNKRLMAMEIIGQRRLTAAIPTLLKISQDGDPKLRAAAYKKVGELGGDGEVPLFFSLMATAKTSAELDPIEQALSLLCAKTADPESMAGKLAALVPTSQPAQKSVLLRVLSSIGTTSALKAVRAAVDDPDATVHADAIRTLGEWKTTDAATELLALAQSANNAGDKTRCLRSYLRLAGRSDLPADQRLVMCKNAASLVQRDDEKKLLLGALGANNSHPAIALLEPFLSDAGVKEEAAAAVLGIAERLLLTKDSVKHAPKLSAVVQKAADAATSPALQKKAQTVLKYVQDALQKNPGAKK
ncbi:MAG: HEAT repeat domain-containing protein [Verrucomicrobiota bacterium]